MTGREVRERYLKFFKEKGHAQIQPARLVLDADQTTLFTSSGMQPLIPYLLGQFHPEGLRLMDSQPCFRAEDIEEVGDNRHTTFFEMLGNWSLGDYFKEQQLEYVFHFLVDELGLDITRLYWTVFKGLGNVPKDDESQMILKEKLLLSVIGDFTKKGINDITVNEDPENGINDTDRIFYYTNENWWSRSGNPDLMPVGEIGGPDVEVFYDFGEELKLHEDSSFKSKPCHPNCDCGRFMEICNSVFIQYKKEGDEFFNELPRQNVDFGGGLERLTAASNNEADIFKNDLHLPIIEEICRELGIEYDGDQSDPIASSRMTANLRIIADHIKAATFLIADGVVPSNKLQGYVLRRLIRRAAIKLHQIDKNAIEGLPNLVKFVVKIYDDTDYFKDSNEEQIKQIVLDEVRRFKETLNKGLALIEKMETVSGKQAFDLYQSYGFPAELTEELLKEKGLEFDKEEFKKEFEKHRELSRTASAGMFKGGLAGHGEVETKYHTATHLLHQALRDVLGPEVFQKGSNITSGRLRFDFNFDRKLSEEEIKEVESIANQRIEEDLKVDHKMMGLEEAKKMGAIGLFNEKYQDNVSIYAIGPGFELDKNAKDQRDRGGYYSAEFCGGPHVEHTGVIGKIKITKEEAVSQGVRRIYAELA